MTVLVDDGSWSCQADHSFSKKELDFSLTFDSGINSSASEFSSYN